MWRTAVRTVKVQPACCDRLVQRKSKEVAQRQIVKVLKENALPLYLRLKLIYGIIIRDQFLVFNYP